VRILIPSLIGALGLILFVVAPSKPARSAALLLAATGFLFLLAMAPCPSGSCTSETPWWSAAAGSLAGICAIGVIFSLLTMLGQAVMHWVRGGTEPR
jgi:hypothetical protein